MLSGYQRLVLIAGLGGGTGMGATPAIAELARAMGIQTFAVVVLPFAIERDRRAAALRLVEDWQSIVDGLRIYDNEWDVRSKGDGQSPLTESFARQSGDIATDLRTWLSCDDTVSPQQ